MLIEGGSYRRVFGFLVPRGQSGKHTRMRQRPCRYVGADAGLLGSASESSGNTVEPTW